VGDDGVEVSSLPLSSPGDSGARSVSSLTDAEHAPAKVARHNNTTVTGLRSIRSTVAGRYSAVVAQAPAVGHNVPMVHLGDLVLSRPNGTAQPLSAYAGRPVVIQIVRYYG
jgi:hypothetical protein